MTHAMQMLMISARHHPLNDEATSMLLSFLNSGVLDSLTRAQVIKACQRSCNLHQTKTGLFYKV